jgi:2-polyprenyl-6-methoxyphenol hydroxylase-like FAD-dependent oxidoreductase
VGLKAHWIGLEGTDDLEMHCGDGGYVGLSRVENGRVNVCGLFDASAVRRGRGCLPGVLKAVGLHRLAERLSGAAVVQGSEVAVAGFRGGWSGSDRLAVGDAFARIPPFAGNGMSMALEGAHEATLELERYCSGEAAWEDVKRRLRSRLRSRFRVRMAWAMVLHPVLRSRAGMAFAAAAASAGLLPVQSIFRALRS